MICFFLAHDEPQKEKSIGIPILTISAASQIATLSSSHEYLLRDVAIGQSIILEEDADTFTVVDATDSLATMLT